MCRDRRARHLVFRHCAIVAFVLGATRPSQAQTQSPFAGSVRTGQATATTLDLSVTAAFERALQYNLGVVTGRENTRAARATRLRSLNSLLPNLSGRISAASNQINLQALGFHLSIPGISLPTVVGPFSVTDARVYV